MTTPKNNGTGAKEVTTTPNSKATNNAKNTSAKATTTPKSEEKKADPKASPTPPKVVEMPPKPKTLKEQIEFFLGLEKLMNIRRRFETHLEAVQALDIEDEELKQFETGNTYGVRIELHDSQRREYNITNPRLVQEMQNHLISLLEGKIKDHDHQILTYGETEEKTAIQA